MLHDPSGWLAGGRHLGAAWHGRLGKLLIEESDPINPKAWTARAAHTAIPSTLPQHRYLHRLKEPCGEQT
jgi:hypothetical protein